MKSTRKRKSVQPVDNRLGFLIGSAKRNEKSKWICLTLSEAESLLSIVRNQLNKAPESVRE
jgi:hypothetical protein